MLYPEFKKITNRLLLELRNTSECALPPALLACSGGVDSMVLLDLLRRFYSKSNPSESLLIFYFDHKQRSATETAKDRKIIKTYCDRHALKFTFDSLEARTKLSEQNLRDARYAAIKKAAQKFSPHTIVFTAHHADDQLETYLFRLLRGAHPTSINGISAISHRDNLVLVRPLLKFQKSFLLKYAKEKQLDWNEDTTNKDLIFSRNRIRNELIPLLESLRKGSSEKILRFFSELSTSHSDITKPALLEELCSGQGVLVSEISFSDLKKTIDTLLNVNSSRTSQAQWNSLKAILTARQGTRSGGGETKIVQFPGGNTILFKKNRIFWNHL